MDELFLDKIKEQVLPLLDAQGVELVDLVIARERGRSILRFLVDKPGGITLDECARLNQEIGRFFDQTDLIQETYLLEVSSPGLDRPLKSARDFQRVQGKLVKIVLHQPLNGQSVWEGLVDGVDEENVIMQSANNQRLVIPRQNIARASLEVRV